jgi:hypothetical protein
MSDEDGEDSKPETTTPVQDTTTPVPDTTTPVSDTIIPIYVTTSPMRFALFTYMAIGILLLILILLGKYIKVMQTDYGKNI